MAKYKVGDRVRVISEKHGHEFDIGSVIEISEVDYDDPELTYASKDEYGDTWWLSDYEITSAVELEPEITVNGAVYILKPEPEHVWKFGDWARHLAYGVVMIIGPMEANKDIIAIANADGWKYVYKGTLTYISTAEIPE